MIELQEKGVKDIAKVAAAILEHGKEVPIVCFYGDLGSGKTTLVKELCKQIGVEDDVKSPTFSIVNEYLSKGNELLYHFDFYRFKSIEEAYDIGVEEYLYSGNLVFIEWPEIVHALLPENRLEVYISYTDSGLRDYEIKILA